MPTPTETTADLFCRLAGITREARSINKMIMPKCEVYYPTRLRCRDMAFKWGNGAIIEFTSYNGGEFWGGIPVRTSNTI